MTEWKSQNASRPHHERSPSGRTGISSTTDVYTLSTTTPFYLAGDDATSQRSLHSWDMEGIDVVGGDKPDTFQTWSQRRAAMVVNTTIFKRTTLVLILLCATLLAIQTRFPSRLIDKALDVILCVFSVEVLLATVFYQEEMAGWLIFDMIIIIECWLSGDRSALVLRSFRLLRSLRKASGIPPLKWVVKAILRVLPRMAAVCGLLLPASLLIFAVWLTCLYPNQFSRIDTSMLVLFQIMTGGTSWAYILSEVGDPTAWVPLSFFVFVSQFIFTSLIVGIMCNAVSSVSESDRIWKSPAASKEVHGPVGNGEELRKLERKVDDLTKTVELLLKGQSQLMGAVSLERSSPTLESSES